MKFTQTEKVAILTRHQNGESITDLCTRYHIPRSTFYTWIKTQQPLITPSGEAINANQLYKMNQHIRKLEQIIEVLQQVNCTASAPLKERLYALEPLHEQYNVHVLCEALKVDRGTFYNHLSRNKKQNNTYQARRSQLSIQIKEVFDESKQIYGAKKIKAVLNERGVVVSDAMVLTLMQEMNLYSIRSGAKKIFEKKQRTPGCVPNFV